MCLRPRRIVHSPVEADGVHGHAAAGALAEEVQMRHHEVSASAVALQCANRDGAQRSVAQP